jgi:hypothetical protein
MASLSGIRNVSVHPASVKPASLIGYLFVATKRFCSLKAAILALPGKITLVITLVITPVLSRLPCASHLFKLSND